MPSLAGVIYPNAFAQTNLIRSISPTFSHCPSSQPFRTFNYKNIEIGSWNLQMNSNCKKSIWTTLYGSIHNRCQLSKELKDAGFVIENSDDATLAVLAYEAWGAASLFEKIDGPFAIALFDEEKEALYLGIDRMGQKALYWTFQNDHFLFSTEIKGLLASGIVPQVASNTALSSFLFFGFIPQDYSAIEGVNKLVPGHYI
ncbi:MAG: hypothetical protein K0U13_01435, partial [Chlamydiae bacterium]|nr:hypothetical protein [Chlamydiota bacterium]